MKLSQIGELSLLEQIRKTFEKKSPCVLVGIGDDAALIKASNKNLLITTDMMTEGIHFDLSFITPYQLGFKLVSVNVSDIYAMGGEPKFILLNLAMNKSTDKKSFDSFFEGVQKAMNLYGMYLVGGDISASQKKITLSATVLGYATKCIKRSGAGIGDKIYVTGDLGDSACGLQLLKRLSDESRKMVKDIVLLGDGEGVKRRNGEKKKSPCLRLPDSPGLLLKWTDVEPLLRRHLMPLARNPKTHSGNATSMIDISDGLLIDLSRICDESKVGARIYAENIPLSAELKKVASSLNISPLKLALSGGEDYELLFTAPARMKIRAKCIGEIVKSQRVITDISGKEKPFSVEGYQHFGP